MHMQPFKLFISDCFYIYLKILQLFFLILFFYNDFLDIAGYSFRLWQSAAGIEMVSFSFLILIFTWFMGILIIIQVGRLHS